LKSRMSGQRCNGGGGKGERCNKKELQCACHLASFEMKKSLILGLMKEVLVGKMRIFTRGLLVEERRLWPRNQKMTVLISEDGHCVSMKPVR